MLGVILPGFFGIPGITRSFGPTFTLGARTALKASSSYLGRLFGGILLLISLLVTRTLLS
jgi:hypothetical protein